MIDLPAMHFQHTLQEKFTEQKAELQRIKKEGVVPVKAVELVANAIKALEKVKPSYEKVAGHLDANTQPLARTYNTVMRSDPFSIAHPGALTSNIRIALGDAVSSDDARNE